MTRANLFSAACRILCIATMIICAFRVSSSDLRTHYEQLFENANEHYSNGQYDTSITLYKEIADAGFSSPALYYNLGNAYYKINALSSAILYYERALKLSPEDADIRFNLDLANKRITDKIEPLPELFFSSWWKAVVHTASVEEWGRFSLIFAFFGFFGFALFLFAQSAAMRKLHFATAIITLAFGAFCWVCAANYRNTLLKKDEAIVFSPSVTAVSSPAPAATQLFVIHEGTKVKILETVEEWHKISLADGNIGWLRKEEVVGI